MSRATKHISWPQLQELVSKMRQDNDRLHLLVVIQSLLGLRISDVLSLRWKDILDNAELSIIEKKTGKSRRMAISESLREAVERECSRVKRIRRVNGKKFNDSEFIFINRWGKKPISVEYVNRHLKSVFEKHGIEAEQISSHAFRKSFCYKILEDNNFSDKGIFLVSRLLNHSNISVTMKYLMLDQREAENTYKGLAI